MPVLFLVRQSPDWEVGYETGRGPWRRSLECGGQVVFWSWAPDPNYLSQEVYVQEGHPGQLGLRLGETQWEPV